MKGFKGILFLLLFAIGFTARSQEDKKVYFDAYIGGPQVTPYLINSYFNNIHAKGLGPFGARMDFFITKSSSIGVDANYMQVNVSGDNIFYVSENGSKNFTATKNYNFAKIRVLVRYAYHFVLKEKLDVYCHAGIGASFWTPNEIRIQDNYNSSIYSSYSYNYVEIKNLVPIGFRTGIGLRYLVAKNVGFNVDIAAGGALLTAGLTVKIK